MLVVNSRLQIPLAEFEFTYTRSSGPGGQNVNKVNSKACLRWPALASPSLPPGVRARFLQKFGSRITVDGDLLIVSQRYRDRGRNADDCLDKLREMLTSIAVAPTVRRKTKPSRSSIKRRLEGKRQTSQKKQSRGRPSQDD
jgi:ribosome-associated protein